jgi:hypothetical protein
MTTLISERIFRSTVKITLVSNSALTEFMEDSEIMAIQLIL